MAGITFLDDFLTPVPLTSPWSDLGGLSISPASHLAHGGTNVGTGGASKEMIAGDVYCEMKCYQDNNNDWMMLKMNSSSGALYDTGAGDGVGFWMGKTGYGESYMGGTKTHSDGWSGIINNAALGATSVLPVTLGIHRISSTVFDFYVNRVKVGRTSTTQAVTGTKFRLGAYNGAGGHFDYFLSADRLLTPHDTSNGPSRIVQ